MSTLLRIRWTRTRLEDQLRESAQDTADGHRRRADASGCAADMDQDEIDEELPRMRSGAIPGADLELTLDTDEDTVSTFSLGANMDEPQVAKQPAAGAPTTAAAATRRRAARLYDHGESTRRPGARMVEPMWRTPDRREPSRWPARAVPPPPQPAGARRGAHVPRGRARPLPIVEVHGAGRSGGAAARRAHARRSTRRADRAQLVRTEEICVGADHRRRRCCS